MTQRPGVCHGSEWKDGGVELYMWTGGHGRWGARLGGGGPSPMDGGG